MLAILALVIGLAFAFGGWRFFPDPAPAVGLPGRLSAGRRSVDGDIAK
jgi:hypothetical protein